MNRSKGRISSSLLLPALLLVSCFPLAMRGDDVSGGHPESIRILSYNIHMWQIPLHELEGVVRKSAADIVGLNEAWSRSQNEQLAKRLGYHVVYGGRDEPASDRSKPHSIQGHYMPQVLLTKFKVVESRLFNAMAAKDHPDFDPEVPIYRGGTMAILETPRGNRIAVFVAHLHPWGDGKNERMTMMRRNEIKGILRQLESYQDGPVVVLGDLNTRSHLDEKGGWKVTRHLAEEGYRDLYRVMHPDATRFPGRTCGDGRIDYIFFNRHVEPRDGQVLEAGVFGSKGYRQSDHLAVFGEIRVGTR